MTIDEGNALIAKYLGIKLKSDNKTYELDSKLAYILKCKTTQFLKFNENKDLLFYALEKISTIKDMCVCMQFSTNKFYISLLYKAQNIEGEWRYSRFSCEREKPADKATQAMFEVVSMFCGWYDRNPECQTEIEYELDYVSTPNEENPQKVVYMKPIEVVCPECGRIYRQEDVRTKEN